MNYQPLVYVHDDFVFSFHQITYIDSSTFNAILGQVLRVRIVQDTSCQIGY